ncbi:hypothetical protein E4L95_03300 [Paracoccus liaowanqingii]|uniref:FAD-binding domain-containing protein n=1 Tax=Paracoccus liaowanqingii TaxID=2560053 RepID=A0A4Z1CRY0_9RHOB|nr:FAD-dependent monooxygenase [Paracoccus liaowanqingii]TGN67909.1 hypothetical protein E4L95_03300 [Paracoccus liaowanqingii]
MTPTYDAVVVGGGPAGASLARSLGDAGRSVLLVERSQGAHQKVCGEFLSHEAIFYLNRMGVDPVKLGAVPIVSVALIRHRAVACAKLPFPAVSLSRFHLDEALLALAADAGVDIRRGSQVRAVRQDRGAWQVEVDDQQITARDVFMANGKHDIRGWKRPPGRQSDLIGFKQRFRLAPARVRDLAGRVELHLFPGGYCGLEPVEGDIANMSLLIKKSRFAQLGSWDLLWDHLMATGPILRERLQDVTALAEKPLSISALPYGFVRPHSDGAWYLGDQAAVIPSFAGNGISMALHSADLAARCYVAGGSSDDFQHAFARDVRRPVGRATLLSRLLVRPGAQAVLSTAARYLPQAMRGIATATRLPNVPRDLS